MTPADRLRSLVKEATRKWTEATTHEEGLAQMQAARWLEDHALVLAELVADMAEAAQACLDTAGEPFAALEVVVARAAALFPEDSA